MTHHVGTSHTSRSRFGALSLLFVAGALASNLFACGGDGADADGETDATGGSSNSGGSAGVGGSSDTGGSAGAGDTGGSGGSSGSGGSAGNGGGDPDPVVVTSCDDYENDQPPVEQSEPLEVLYHFSGGYSPPDGRGLWGGLVEGPDGNFYGVTVYGGVTESGSDGAGVLFRLSPDGTFTKLHTFDSPDGMNPTGPLTLGPDCALYGLTQDGGGPESSGTAFRVTLAGELNTLTDFPWEAAAGWAPWGQLLLASDGNYYGLSAHSTGARGAVFKLTPDGTLTGLGFLEDAITGHDETGGWGLIEGSDGNFYGVATAGGAYDLGAIFSVTPAGELDALWDFEEASADTGSMPAGPLVEGPDGNLYGTMYDGGEYNGGTIYRVTPDGDYSTLVSFADDYDAEKDCFCDVNRPMGPLVVGSDGYLYGLLSQGQPDDGTSGRGAIVRVTLEGEVSVVAYLPDTLNPTTYPALVESSDGYLYGVTDRGGDNDGGAIFRVRMPE